VGLPSAVDVLAAAAARSVGFVAASRPQPLAVGASTATSRKASASRRPSTLSARCPARRLRRLGGNRSCAATNATCSATSTAAGATLTARLRTEEAELTASSVPRDTARSLRPRLLLVV
jgi:hypothetical protein